MTRRPAEYEVPEAGVRRRCRACHAEIVFVPTGFDKSNRRKWTPLDLGTAERGLDGVLRAISHFRTCTNPGRFSRKPRRRDSSG